MEIEYYTVATTRCMGIWNDERIVVPRSEAELKMSYIVPTGAEYDGFETFADAEAFVLAYPKKLQEKHPGCIGEATLQKEGDGAYKLLYEGKLGFGDDARWTLQTYLLEIRKHKFALVPHEQVAAVTLD